jgi:hypothetical protein
MSFSFDMLLNYSKMIEEYIIYRNNVFKITSQFKINNYNLSLACDK